MGRGANVIVEGCEGASKSSSRAACPCRSKGCAGARCIRLPDLMLVERDELAATEHSNAKALKLYARCELLMVDDVILRRLLSERKGDTVPAKRMIRKRCRHRFETAERAVFAPQNTRARKAVRPQEVGNGREDVELKDPR